MSQPDNPMRCRSVSLSCKGKINHLIRLPKIPTKGWEVTDAYGLLLDVDQATPFIEAIDTSSGVCVAFIVTDDDRHFQSVTKRLPKDVEPVRLYESYLTNFSFTSGEWT
ncbi:MAG: hypothetical protein ACYCE6_03325, partial [Escherichia coli]